MKILTNILNRPFPIVESSKEKFLVSLGYGLSIFIFLIAFQPFGLDKVEVNKLIYFAGYGIITTIVVLVNGFITMNVFKKFFLPENWNIWKSFVHNFIMIIPIAILNWLYFIHMEKPASLDYSLLQFVFMTIAVGVFPGMFLLLYFEQKLRNKNVLLSEQVNHQLELSSSSNSDIIEFNFNSQNSPIIINNLD